MTKTKGNSFNIFDHGMTYDGYIIRKYEKVYELPDFIIHEDNEYAMIYLKAIHESVLLADTGKYNVAIYGNNLFVLETGGDLCMSVMKIDELRYTKIGRKVFTTNMQDAMQQFCECPIIPENIIYPVIIYDSARWPYKVNRKAYSDIMFTTVE